MTTLVVDCSVAPKWYVEEVHMLPARRLLWPEYELAAPQILASEFCNVALQKFRRGQITSDEADVVAAQAARLPVQLLDSMPYLNSAYRLARLHHPSVYDCLYAAVALALGCQVVTADRPFYLALEAALPGTMLWIEDVPEDVGP